MSATPPPPPPPSSSGAAQPRGRPSGGPYRGGGGGPTDGATRPRASPQQQPARTGINPLFTFSGGHTGPAPNIAGTGSTTTSSGASAARANAASRTHVDLAGSRSATSGSTAQSQQQQQQQQPLSPPSDSSPLSPVPAVLLRSLTAAVHESLAGYLYYDAIELAQRLFNEDASYANLHLLAHCYMLSGSMGTAYRLLHHHYPFFEVHVTRPRTAGGPLGGNFAIVDGGALPLDGRRTWSSSNPANATAPTNAFLLNGLAHGQIVDLSHEVVDLKAQWDCQYLLGVCCYRTQHYEDGVKVLSQLMYVKHQLDSAGAALRKQLQQQKQQQQSSSSSPLSDAASTADAERQLRSYAFATEARLSQVLYWLGLCEKHRQRPPFALDYLHRSFTAQPTRLDAFQEYVRLAWPSEATARDLLTVKEPLAEEEEEGDGEEAEEGGAAWYQMTQHQQRPPQRRGRDAEHVQRDDEEHASLTRVGAPVSNASRDGGGGGGSGGGSANSTQRPAAQSRGGVVVAKAALTLDAPPLTASQRRCIQQYLQPFLRALFLSITYRCPEAVDALQSLLLRQQQQQQSSGRSTSTSTSANGNGNGGGATQESADTVHSQLMAGSQSAQQRYTRSPGTSNSSGVVTRGHVRPVSGVPPSVSPLVLRHLALAQFHNGDVQESAETFERLLRTAPWDLTNDALVYYSTALWHLKSESALGSLAQRLTDAEPFHPTTFCVVANAYSLIKDPRDALVMLKRAVQLAPTLAYAHALYGYELLGQDNKAEAENAFKTALAVDRTLYIAYAGLGERFIREEQVDRARGYYKEAVKINPTPAIMNRFALTYHRQNNSPTHLKCALRLYSESLQRHPNNVTARRQRADVLLRLDRPKEALEELKALLVQCPGEAAIYMALGECMVCLRRPQEALQHYQTAMHLDPRRESYVQGCIDRLVAANML
jgi:tetratricopeptide (TPR) repeat protein